MPSISTSTSSDDLCKPLLESSSNAGTSTSSTHDLSRFEPAKTSAILMFATIGFAIQIVSLGSYAYMITEWGADPSVVLETDDSSERFWYFIIQCLSQVDLCFYCLIWVGFSIAMTRRGVSFVMSHFDESLQSQRCTNAMRDFVFGLGIHALSGLVLGAFASWSLLDVCLGFPVPYKSIVVTTAMDLVLVYIMAIFYDCGRGHEDDDEDDVE